MGYVASMDSDSDCAADRIFLGLGQSHAIGSKGLSKRPVK